MSLLKVENVSKNFGSLIAVRGVSMSVELGELRAVIGPNGAGKTTFFNLISGFLTQTSGRIIFDGEDISSLLPARRVWRGIARTFQVTEVFPELTVGENLRIAVEVAAGYRLRPWLSREADGEIRARVTELMDMGGIADKADRLVGELTHGDQRVTEIMMALALKPRLLLLDEPTAGMGDQETYDITRLIRKLHQNQKFSIVLIEHDMRVVFHLADRIMVLAEGAMLAEGGPGGLFGKGGGMSGVALEADNLHTYYGKSHILYGVGLEVREGEIVALLGRNGAGKTTTLRSLVGLTHAREGVVRIFGHVTTDWPPYRVAALGVGYVQEGRRIFSNLTVEENLKVPVERPGPWTVGRIYELFPRLAERRVNKGRQLSGGEQEMLAIARALLLNPKLVLLDEPSQGLAPLIVQEVFKVVTSARVQGISVLLVEQNVRAAVEIADRAYVLDDGHIVYGGTATDFGSDEKRVRALAGASAEEWTLAE
jgi:branched-chain amino acid transport system ATP-binding protein